MESDNLSGLWKRRKDSRSKAKQSKAKQSVMKYPRDLARRRPFNITNEDFRWNDGMWRRRALCISDVCMMDTVPTNVHRPPAFESGTGIVGEKGVQGRGSCAVIAHRWVVCERGSRYLPGKRAGLRWVWAG